MSGVRILIVDDDRSLRDVLRRALVLDGYEVETAAGGAEGLTMIADGAPDAVVLDVGLPDVDGLEVCQRLRAAGDRSAVLMLTARAAISDRIDGLDAGADDYLTKPFDVGELQARLRALLRRTGEDGDGEAVTVGELRLDDERRGVWVDDRFVELTRTEHALLEVLMRNPGRVLPHDVIYDRVWGYDFGPESNALRVYVSYLRRKLDEAGATTEIRTVRGVGYSLREP
jgi:two-component system response regulator MprA